MSRLIVTNQDPCQQDPENAIILRLALGPTGRELNDNQDGYYRRLPLEVSHVPVMFRLVQTGYGDWCDSAPAVSSVSHFCRKRPEKKLLLCFSFRYYTNCMVWELITKGVAHPFHQLCLTQQIYTFRSYIHDKQNSLNLDLFTFQLHGTLDSTCHNVVILAKHSYSPAHREASYQKHSPSSSLINMSPREPGGEAQQYRETCPKASYRFKLQKTLQLRTS